MLISPACATLPATDPFNNSHLVVSQGNGTWRTSQPSHRQADHSANNTTNKKVKERDGEPRKKKDQGKER